MDSINRVLLQMKTYVYLGFNISGTSLTVMDVKSIYNIVGQEKKFKESSIKFYSLFINIKNPMLQKIKDILNGKNIKWLERVENIYKDSELKSCKLLLFTVNLAPKGEGGPKYGTKFDLSTACNACGTGAKQIGPLLLNRSEIPRNKDLINTLDNEVLISPKVKEEFEKRKIKGVELRAVLNFRTNQPMEYLKPHLPC